MDPEPARCQGQAAMLFGSLRTASQAQGQAMENEVLRVVRQDLPDHSRPFPVLHRQLPRRRPSRAQTEGSRLAFHRIESGYFVAPRRLKPDAVSAKARAPFMRACEHCHKQFETKLINK